MPAFAGPAVITTIDYGTIDLEPISKTRQGFQYPLGCTKKLCKAEAQLASGKTLGLRLSHARTTKGKDTNYSTKKRLHHEPVDQSGELLVVARGRRDSGNAAVHRVRVVLEEARHAQRRVPPIRIAHADD